jgi:uracil-DNA glycosylase
LPNSEEINLFLPILKKEIEIVQPQYVVTFGAIPFEKLTNQKIKIRDYYTEIMKNKKLRFFDVGFGNFRTRIIPFYFQLEEVSLKKLLKFLN